MKKQSREAFSVPEVIVAIAIFSIAAISMTASMVNGLLCRSRMADHNSDALQYQLASRIVRNSKSIDDATGISHITLPSGKRMQTDVIVRSTNLKNLFSVDITTDDTRYTVFIANKNWQ
jgi:prepilin-type N-terminal cleavage/methylation domain-containing protein